MKKIVDFIYKPFSIYPDKIEQLVYLLIFLFPIAGMSVRHWITNIFNLLVIIGLFTLRKPRTRLLKEEFHFLLICAAYVSVFVFSALANGWTMTQTHHLGTELRFLMVIPLYILVRRYPDSSVWLLRGAVIGGFVLFAQAYYEVYILNHGIASGVYSKNILGSLAVLTSIWTGHIIWKNHKTLDWRIFALLIISILASLSAAALSGSRGAYSGLVVVSLLSIFIFTKPRWILVTLALSCFIFYSALENSSTIKRGVYNASSEFQKYLLAEDHIKDNVSTTSIGTRLEMARTSIYLIKENPFSGVGPGNYKDSMKKLVAANKASKSVLHGHPHNAFLEAIISKGILGLVTLLLLLYYPVIIFSRSFKKYKSTAVLGIFHITAISAFSLTDASVILKNNYTSILLLGIVIFLSSHLHNKRTK